MDTAVSCCTCPDFTIDGYRLTSIITLPLCFHHQWDRHQPSTVYSCNQGNKPSAINVVLGIPTQPASTALQPMGRPAENVVWRPHGVHILGDGVSNEHDDTVWTHGPTDVDFQVPMVTASADRAVPQGAWELPECQMDAIPDQGRGNILGLGECIAASFVRVLTGAVLRQ